MDTLKKKAARVMNGIHLGSVGLAIFLLVAMAVIIIINVFMRYVLNSGIRWAEEISKLLMVWFTFIGMAVGIKQGLHISLHLLPKNLPAKLEFFLTFLKDVISLAIGVVFLVYGWRLVETTSKSIMPGSELPSSLLYLILPIAAVLIISEALMDILRIDDDPGRIDALFKGGRK